MYITSLFHSLIITTFAKEKMAMGFNYRYPVLSDFDSEEEYLAACDAYEAAEARYIDQYIENNRQ